MSLVEGIFVGATAVCIGALSALPALFGISWAMLGTVSTGVGPGVVLTLAAVVMAIGVGSIVSGALLLNQGRRANTST